MQVVSRLVGEGITASSALGLAGSRGSEVRLQTHHVLEFVDFLNHIRWKMSPSEAVLPPLQGSCGNWCNCFQRLERGLQSLLLSLVILEEDEILMQVSEVWFPTSICLWFPSSG